MPVRPSPRRPRLALSQLSQLPFQWPSPLLSSLPPPLPSWMRLHPRLPFPPMQPRRRPVRTQRLLPVLVAFSADAQYSIAVRPALPAAWVSAPRVALVRPRVRPELAVRCILLAASRLADLPEPVPASASVPAWAHALASASALAPVERPDCCLQGRLHVRSGRAPMRVAVVSSIRKLRKAR
jgi:hypothetical protein